MEEKKAPVKKPARKRKRKRTATKKTVTKTITKVVKAEPKTVKEFSFSDEYQKALERLTPKQRRFVEEYLVDLIAKQAAIRAGFSVKNADKIGSQLLDHPRVSACIRMAMAERSKRTGITADRVIEEIAKIALVNPIDVINSELGTVKSDAKKADTAAIQSVKVKTIPTENGDITEREVKLADKSKALELLGKHLGLWDDKTKVDIVIGLADRMKRARERAVCK